MESYKQEFIEFMVESDVLKFGEFTLKSGRKSLFQFTHTEKLSLPVFLIYFGQKRKGSEGTLSSRTPFIYQSMQEKLPVATSLYFRFT